MELVNQSFTRFVSCTGHQNWAIFMNSPQWQPCPGTVWFWPSYRLNSNNLLRCLSSLTFSWSSSWPISAFPFLSLTSVHLLVPLTSPPVPMVPTLFSVTLQSLSHCLSHWLLVFLPHIHFVSLSSGLCPLQILLYTHTHSESHSCQSWPLPPSMLFNSPTTSQYQMKDQESRREELQTLLVLREGERKEKRKLDCLCWHEGYGCSCPIQGAYI